MASPPTSNRVTHWETHRGRNNEFDKTEAGTAICTLQNRDGLFDPLNPPSPYIITGNLLPIRQFRITANTPAHPDVFHDIFTGYVEDWSFERYSPNRAELDANGHPVGGSLATLNAVDGFELLTQAQIYSTKNHPRGGQYFAVQHCDDRIRAALGFAGWPAARTSIFSGNVFVQDITYDVGTSMLTVIQDAADAEFPGLANFYMDKSGRAVFRGRFYRFNPFDSSWDIPAIHARSANLYRFGDDGAIDADDTLLPMANLTWTISKERIYNYAQIIPANMNAKSYNGQIITGMPSIKKYGKRDISIQGLLTLTSDGILETPMQTASQECKRFGMYYVTNYATPHVRPQTLEVHSKFEDDRIWNFLVNVEIGDVVELWTVNPGGGGFTGQQFFVEGIHNVVDAIGHWPQWVSTYDLAPRANWNFWPDPL